MKCQDCGESCDEVIAIKVGPKKMKLCEECAEIRQEEMDMADEAEGAMQSMMEYKGR